MRRRDAIEVQSLWATWVFHKHAPICNFSGVGLQRLLLEYLTAFLPMRGAISRPYRQPLRRSPLLYSSETRASQGAAHTTTRSGPRHTFLVDRAAGHRHQSHCEIVNEGVEARAWEGKEHHKQADFPELGLSCRHEVSRPSRDNTHSTTSTLLMIESFSEDEHMNAAE